MKILSIALVLIFTSMPAIAWDDDLGQNQNYFQEQDEVRREREIQKDMLREARQQTWELQQQRREEQQRNYEQQSREFDREMRKSYHTSPWGK